MLGLRLEYRRGGIDETTRTVYVQELGVHERAAAAANEAAGDPTYVSHRADYHRDDGTELPAGVVRLLLSGSGESERPPFKRYRGAVDDIYAVLASEQQDVQLALPPDGSPDPSASSSPTLTLTMPLAHQRHPGL